ENSKADLYLLASKITRAAGDTTQAIKYAQKGITAFGTTQESAGASLLHAQHRALVADIYRSLIQPDQAFNIIQAGPAASVTDFTNKQDYLDFICLHTELALETGNQVRSDFQDLQLDTADPYFPRLMAIKARLMNKAGNYKQAEQILQLALKSISNLEGPGSLPAWSASYSKYLAMNSIVEAALDLGAWEQAMNGSECIIESSPDEPWSHLNLARSLVLKAEFYNLCEVFGVSKHKPSADSISKQTYCQFMQYIDKLRTVLDPYKAELITKDYELTEDQIYRWQSRAEIAFGQIEESHCEPCEILVNHRIPGDAAAMIVHLHQLDLADHSSDAVTRIIKIARSYPRNPAVLLQVALAIQDENPADAMKSLQSVLEQNPSSKGPTIAFINILLAKIALSQGEFDTALQAAETALEFWYDEPDWHILAAEICKRNSDITAAISHLLEAIKLAPKTITYHMQLGKIYFENASDDAHMLRQAGKTFENALSLDGENVSALVLLANAQYQLNDPSSAEANARKALLLAPDRADINLLLSEVAIRNNDYQGAYEYANQAIQLNPKDIQAGIILARSLAALG
ncbi:MAG TPA: tetratricopeptide repeat protein, partial [Anaerolineales bacterium]